MVEKYFDVLNRLDAELHWLPIRQRITLKTAVPVWKCLPDKAPRYLADLCIPVTSVEGRRQLHSATTGTLLLSRARTSTGQRSFAVFGPATWNSLPPSLRIPELSLSTFKRRLKTQLFQHPWSIVRRRCDWSARSAPYTIFRLNSTWQTEGQTDGWNSDSKCCASLRHAATQLATLQEQSQPARGVICPRFPCLWSSNT